MGYFPSHRWIISLLTWYFPSHRRIASPLSDGVTAPLIDELFPFSPGRWITSPLRRGYCPSHLGFVENDVLHNVRGQLLQASLDLGGGAVAGTAHGRDEHPEVEAGAGLVATHCPVSERGPALLYHPREQACSTRR